MLDVLLELPLLLPCGRKAELGLEERMAGHHREEDVDGSAPCPADAAEPSAAWPR